MSYYVYDIYGDGYATISENLPEEYEYYIGEYSSKEEADKAASEYEDYIQNQIDKLEEDLSYDEVYDEDDE